MNKLTLAAPLLIVTALLSGPALAESPLADAIENGRRDAALELLEQGADVNAAQGDGTTPLHWAAYQLDADLVQRLSEGAARKRTRRTATARARSARPRRPRTLRSSRCC